MHSSCNFQALLLPPLLLLLLMAATGPTRALTEDESRTMVELHNYYRAQVSPPASDMLQMRWDAELAAFAKAYAQKCIWGHNKERGRRGENLFAITDEGVDMPLAMENWHQEREHYNLSTATCEPGQMCGHYTQVVWSKTERIGCGSHFCEKLQGVEEINIQLLVCNYEPPGNVKGKRPYQEGTPCSQCPPGYSCENSLCEPTRGPEEAQDSPQRVTEVPSTQATEAPGSRESGTTSLATERSHFSLVTEVSVSLATEAPPAVATKAPSSLATEGPSTTTEVPPSLTAEVLSISATHKQLSWDEGPNNFPTSTHVTAPKSTDNETSKTSATSMIPERFLYPKMSLAGTGESLPQTQEEKEAEAELPASRELSASFLPAQENHSGLQASLDLSGHLASKFLPNFPSASASANATGGRTLALRSSWPGVEGPEKPGWETTGNSGHAWGPLKGLLLPPALLLAGAF